MNIGIFGGTFNPIHNCHLRIAQQVWRRMRLDRVIFVPSGYPPHKPRTGLLSARNRLEMVHLAIRGYPYFSLSDQEVRRPGKSYAIETVLAFTKRYPKASLYFILGVDSFLEIESWRAVSRLFRLCHFVVVSRYGFSFQQLEKVAPTIKIDPSILQALDRGRLRKAKVPLLDGKALFLLRLPLCRISSTEIRERLKARQDLKKFLPEAVKSYILKNRLYIT